MSNPNWPPMPDTVWRTVSFHGLCETCRQTRPEGFALGSGVVDWVECPTGGWWAHRDHPEDNHDAVVPWSPEEAMNAQGEYYQVDS